MYTYIHILHVYVYTYTTCIHDVYFCTYTNYYMYVCVLGLQSRIPIKMIPTTADISTHVSLVTYCIIHYSMLSICACIWYMCMYIVYIRV